MEYITVKLIPPDRNLTIYNLYSPLNKAINFHSLQPNSEDRMIVGDFQQPLPYLGLSQSRCKGRSGTLDC